MYLKQNQIILRGKSEINDVLSSVPGYQWHHATEESHDGLKEFPLEIYRDSALPDQRSEAEVAHDGLWDRAMQTKDDAELLRYLELSDSLGRLIIRVRSGYTQPEAEVSARDVPIQDAYEPEFVAPVVSPGSSRSSIAGSPITGPVLPIA